MGKMQIELTKSQCESLACWIETELLPAIRRDEETTSLQWVEDMIHVYKMAKAATERGA